MLCGLFFGALWHTNNEETLGRKAPARCHSFATNYFFQGLPPPVYTMSLLIVTHCWNILFCAVVSGVFRVSKQGKNSANEREKIYFLSQRVPPVFAIYSYMANIYFLF